MKNQITLNDKMKDINLNIKQSDIDIYTDNIERPIFNSDKDFILEETTSQIYLSEKTDQNEDRKNFFKLFRNFKGNKKNLILHNNVYTNSNNSDLFKTELIIPSKFNLANAKNMSLNINSTSGNIKVQNLNFERFNINSTSSNVLINNVIAKDFNSAVTSGNIELNRVKYDKCNIDNTSGNIYIISSIIKDLCIDLSSGNITLEDIFLISANIQNINGDINANIIQNMNNYITSITTVAGSIDQNSPTHYNDKPNNKITIDSIDGNIKVYFK